MLQEFRDLFYKPGRRYAELLEREYLPPQDGASYQAAEPTRAPKKENSVSR